jgi:hypothetical protein
MTSFSSSSVSIPIIETIVDEKMNVSELYTECQELKNIKYKTMLLTGNSNKMENTSCSKTEKVESYLDNDMEQTKNKPWSKLDKTIKIKKMEEFVESTIREKNNLDDNEVKMLKQYLVDCFDNKKLQSMKDLVYDKPSGKIKTIPILLFNQTSRTFTLKRNEKRVSTIKCLGLGKKKKIDIKQITDNTLI